MLYTKSVLEILQSKGQYFCKDSYKDMSREASDTVMACLKSSPSILLVIYLERYELLDVDALEVLYRESYTISQVSDVIRDSLFIESSDPKDLRNILAANFTSYELYKLNKLLSKPFTYGEYEENSGIIDRFLFLVGLYFLNSEYRDVFALHIMDGMFEFVTVNTGYGVGLRG